MDWDAGTLRSELHIALDAYDFQRVTQLSGEIAERLRRSPARCPPALAEEILGALRRKRRFQDVVRVADALLGSGCDTALVRRQYAQALLDQGYMSAAIVMLAPLADQRDNLKEQAEARGLLGRAYKQIYVEAAGATERAVEALDLSIQHYLSTYRSAPDTHLWHGINAVALAARAGRNSLAAPGAVEPEATARAILAAIGVRTAAAREKGEMPEHWDLATAMEAHVTLGQHEEALGFAAQYAEHRGCDAFELASTLRQMTEVWQLVTTREPGRSLLPLLQGALLKRSGGALSLSSADDVRVHEPPAGLQKVLGNGGFETYEWLRTGLKRARGVARMEDELGKAWGTGFVVRGGDLRPAWGDELVVLTNSHVVRPREQSFPAPLKAHEAWAHFTLPDDEQSKAGRHRMECLWSSPPDELDCCILRLTSRPEGVTPLPMVDFSEVADHCGRIFLLGHARGADLVFSLHDNLLLDHEIPVIHYRSAAEGGSSGSPLFDGLWRVIGLHHRGLHEMPRLHGQSGSYPANEGIMIDAIRARLA